MERAYRIEISAEAIQNSRQNSDGGVGADRDGSRQEKKEKTLYAQAKGLAGALGIISAATSAYGYVSSRVGIETGNMQYQYNMRAFNEVGGKLLTGALAIAGGPITTGAFVIGNVLQFAERNHTYEYNRDMENKRINFLKERAGYTIGRR